MRKNQVNGDGTNNNNKNIKNFVVEAEKLK